MVTTQITHGSFTNESNRQHNVRMLQKPQDRHSLQNKNETYCCLAHCSSQTKVAVSLNNIAEYSLIQQTTPIPNALSFCSHFVRWRSQWLPLFNFETDLPKNALVVKFRDNEDQARCLALACHTIEKVLAKDSQFCVPENWHELDFKHAITSAFTTDSANSNNESQTDIGTAYVLDFAKLYGLAP